MKKTIGLFYVNKSTNEEVKLLSIAKEQVFISTKLGTQKLPYTEFDENYNEKRNITKCVTKVEFLSSCMKFIDKAKSSSDNLDAILDLIALIDENKAFLTFELIFELNKFAGRDLSIVYSHEFGYVFDTDALVDIAENGDAQYMQSSSLHYDSYQTPIELFQSIWDNIRSDLFLITTII